VALAVYGGVGGGGNPLHIHCCWEGIVALFWSLPSRLFGLALVHIVWVFIGGRVYIVWVFIGGRV